MDQETRSKIIAKHARGKSEAEIARCVEQMQALKTHPREETLNRFLMKRAERVYRELSLIERQILGELIDGFEAALEIQESEVIVRHREELTEFLDRAEHGYLEEPPDEQDELA